MILKVLIACLAFLSLPTVYQKNCPSLNWQLNCCQAWVAAVASIILFKLLQSVSICGRSDDRQQGAGLGKMRLEIVLENMEQVCHKSHSENVDQVCLHRFSLSKPWICAGWWAKEILGKLDCSVILVNFDQTHFLWADLGQLEQPPTPLWAAKDERSWTKRLNAGGTVGGVTGTINKRER